MDISLNGKVFSRGPKAMTDRHAGFYRGHKHSVTISNRAGLKVAVINRHGVLCCATQLDDGKWWYSFADIALIGSFDSYSSGIEQVQAAREMALRV
jgi:hypothetical protein